jgi:hypothetical protein
LFKIHDRQSTLPLFCLKNNRARSQITSIVTEFLLRALAGSSGGTHFVALASRRRRSTRPVWAKARKQGAGATKIATLPLALLYIAIELRRSFAASNRQGAP